ncbi:hypothetical protein [Halorussus amylolyticus]|uniref:hypothetical protein n=1 Tax=Halorussus amylolyticus TaxID=1126242 RepID=UPI001051448A|nr:hypothetical protein [Halorussus amylolyticus]
MSDSMPTERELLRRINAGLDTVCEERNISLTPGDAIKRQKYVDIALHHWLEGVEHPPVTMSWFKYGLNTPAGGGGVAMDAGIDGTQTPSIESDPVEEFIELGEDDFANFYRSDEYYPSLSHANDATHEFLRQFYEQHAPDRFKRLYLANVQLRECFKMLRQSVDPETERLDTYTLDTQYEKAITATAGLELELGDEAFARVSETVPALLNLVELSFLGIADRGQDAVSYDVFTYVTSLEEFYDEVAWTLVAHCLSLATSKGPGADDLDDRSRSALTDHESEFTEQLEDMEAELMRIDAYPSPSAFPTRTDALDEKIDELFGVVDTVTDEPAQGESE